MIFEWLFGDPSVWIFVLVFSDFCKIKMVNFSEKIFAKMEWEWSQKYIKCGNGMCNAMQMIYFSY